MVSIENKRVLVIGGSSGIGFAVAAKALAKGAKVTIASRSESKLKDAAARLGVGVEHRILDATKEDAVEKFFADPQPWDHIIISSAQTAFGPARTLDLRDAKSAMESKFWGAYHVARVARIAATGSLTLISGYLSERPLASSVLQGAINAALESLARGLALELSPVRVNAVSPGITDTPLWSYMAEEERKRMFDAVAQSIPTKTIGEPDDVANAVIFLLETRSATGTTVRVDGGATIA